MIRVADTGTGDVGEETDCDCNRNTRAEAFENQPCGPGLQRDSGSGRHAAEGGQGAYCPAKELAHVYVLTADTYGTVTRQCEPLGITVRTFPREGAAGCKEEIVKGLEGGVACLGNGLMIYRCLTQPSCP